jgi:two-component system, LytTR family, response regulator
MGSIRTLVVEDQALARERLVELLSAETDVEVVAACGTGSDAVASIRALSPDLVLLDLHMPDLDGFGVVSAVGSAMPLTIFVTAYDEFALKAFEVHAFDYLLKPFGRERLQQALARARTRLAEGREEQLARRFVSLVGSASPDAPRVSDRLAVKSGGRVVMLQISELDAIESEGNYVRLHSGGQVHLVRETMANIEGRLSGHRFVRVHRGWIVNLDRVRRLVSSSTSDPELVMQDGRKVRVGRAYRHAVERRIGEVRSAK